MTPGDWIAHRFGSPTLTLLANLLLVLAVANYLLAQLVAMGHVTEGLSGGTVPYWVGVVLLTLVVIVYETAGGDARGGLDRLRAGGDAGRGARRPAGRRRSHARDTWRR